MRNKMIKERSVFNLLPVFLLLLVGINSAFLFPRKILAAGNSDGKVTICILDSGWNRENGEGWNYVAEDQDLTDHNGHGTLITEILEENAPDAELVMLKCFDREMEDSGKEDIMDRAIRDCVDKYHGDIINMSWTLNQEKDELHDAVKYAQEKGAILVAAAGNLSMQTPLGSLVYPAAWEEVIGVGGVDLDEEGNPASSLWYLQSEAVFVCADGNYKGEKGSSFAVPQVTAVLADYLKEEMVTGKMRNSEKAEKSDSARTQKARAYLQEIAEDAGKTGYDTIFGWGYIRLK